MSVYYLQTGSTDPAYNLAFEEYVLNHYRNGNIVILWQNHNAVIVGRNQNAEAEINRPFVEQHGIRVVRRNTGGGAVYHDMGNLNYSFITDAGDLQDRSATAGIPPRCFLLEIAPCLFDAFIGFDWVIRFPLPQYLQDHPNRLRIRRILFQFCPKHCIQLRSWKPLQFFPEARIIYFSHSPPPRSSATVR